MKSLTLVYYGTDGDAAKAAAAKIRKDGGSAQLRHTYAFDDVKEPDADRVLMLSCVSEYDRQRIVKAYGMASANATVPPPPPPPPADPLAKLPANWRDKPAMELKQIAASVNGGRSVENVEQAISEIEAALAARK